MKRVVFLLMLLCVAPAVFAAGFENIGWYPVDEWEIDLCRKWGGDHKVISQVLEPYLANRAPLTVTLQSKQTFLPDGNRVYEVGYYIEPFIGTATFRIVLVGEEDSFALVPATEISPGGISEYLVHTSRKEFTHAQIHVDQLEDVIEVPIVTT